MRHRKSILLVCALLLISAAGAAAQSAHSNKGTGASPGAVLNVTAFREDKKTDPIRMETLALFENGIEQKIRNFAVDPSPARIAILVDNSLTLQTSVEAMKAAAMEFAYEIFDGDQLFTIAYDEKPEIIQEWTDDAKKLEASFGLFRKKGNPYLFDAIGSTIKEVLMPLMPGTRKTAIVIISDGLDRGSKTSFDLVLNELQGQNVTVYGLQLPDRTGGAYRRDQPKANAVMNRLAEETGGRVFPFDDPTAAAKAICDELRKNRYLLSYSPTNTSTYDARRILLIGNEGVTLRTKMVHPPTVK